MSSSKKGGGKAGKLPKQPAKLAVQKKPKKKISNFAQFWNRLLRRDRKKVAGTVGPTERTVKRAVDKVAKNLHLKKEERQQVANVLLTEVQRRALEKKQIAQQRGTVQPGASAYPYPVQSNLFDEGQDGSDKTPQVSVVELPNRKGFVSDLEMQRKSFIGKAAPTTSVSFGTAGSVSLFTARSMSHAWSHDKFGSQPESITLDKSAVTDMKQHMMVNIMKQFIVDNAKTIREQANVKSPEDMNPEELVRFRRENPAAWDQLVRQNTVVSFALCKPTADDTAKAQSPGKNTNRPRPRVKFDDDVEVTKVPVGKDFCANERKIREQGKLQKK